MKKLMKSRLWLNNGTCIRLRPQHVDHVWSYDLLHHRTEDGRFYEAICTLKPSYGIHVIILYAISYSGTNRGDSDYRDGTGIIKYYSRKKMISTPFGKAFRYAYNEILFLHFLPLKRFNCLYLIHPAAMRC